MWYLIPPLSEKDSKGRLDGRGRGLHGLESEVVELWAANDRGSEGTAWLYRSYKSSFAKDIFVGNGKGILFARRYGSGIGVTYSTHGDNIVGQAAKFVATTTVLSALRFKPRTKYRIGSISNAGRMAQDAVKARCTLQVIAMTKQQFQSRDDGVYFTNSDRLPFNTMLNGLQEAGVISTDMVQRQWARGARGGKGGVIELGDDGNAGNLAD